MNKLSTIAVTISNKIRQIRLKLKKDILQFSIKNLSSNSIKILQKSKNENHHNKNKINLPLTSVFDMTSAWMQINTIRTPPQWNLENSLGSFRMDTFHKFSQKGRAFVRRSSRRFGSLTSRIYIYLLSLLFPPLIPREEVKGNVSQRCSLFSSLSPSLSLCQAVSSTRISPSSWRGFWLRARTLLSYWINMYFACIDTMAVPRVAFSWIIHWGWINF